MCHDGKLLIVRHHMQGWEFDVMLCFGTLHLLCRVVTPFFLSYFAEWVDACQLTVLPLLGLLLLTDTCNRTTATATGNVQRAISVHKQNTAHCIPDKMLLRNWMHRKRQLLTNFITERFSDTRSD